MTPRKIGKAKMAKFLREASAHLESHGGTSIVPITPSFQSYELTTRAGRMTAAIELNHELVYTVFCKFDDPDQAKLICDCNPYSGKYNFHVSNVGDLDEIIRGFRFHVDKVM